MGNRRKKTFQVMIFAVLLLFVQSIRAQEPITLLGHTGAVSAVQFAPAGKVIATASFDRTIRLWNAATRAPIRTLTGHEGQVLSLAISPNGRTLASGSRDNTVKIWDMYVPDPLAKFEGHAEAVGVVELDPKGGWVVSGGASGAVKIWNRGDGKLLHDLKGHTAAITRADIHTEGSQLVTGDAAGVIKLWNPADGAGQGSLGAHVGKVTGLAYRPGTQTLISAGEGGAVKLWQLPLVGPRTLPAQAAAVTAVAISQDAKLIVTAADKQVQIFDHTAAQPQTRKLEGRADAVTALALSANSALIASASANGIIKFWNTADGADRLTVEGHVGAIHATTFDPQGERLASAGADGTVRVWTLPVAPKAIAGPALQVTKVAFSVDGKRIAAAGMAGGKPVVIIRNTTDGATVATLLGHEGVINALAFSADATKLVTGSVDTTARVWNLADAKFLEIAKIKTPAAVTAVVFNADATQVFTGGADNMIKQWNVADLAEARTIPGHTGPVTALVLAGPTLVSGSADMTVRLWSAAAGAAVRTINHGAAVRSLAVSKDNAKIASGGANKLVKVFNAADGAAVATLSGHAGPISGVAFSADAARVATCSNDGARLWNIAGAQLEVFKYKLALHGVSFTADNKSVAAGAVDNSLHLVQSSLVTIISGHQGAVTGVAFSADGAQLFSGGADKTVRQWNLADGKQLRTLAGPTDAVTGLAISGDGGRLAAASADKSVYTWNAKEPVAATPLAADATLAHAAAVRSVNFNQDGTRLATCGDDMLVRVWDTTAGRELQRFAGHEAAATSVAFAGDNKTIVSGSADKTARLWTLAATKMWVADPNKVNDLALLPDGTQLATAGDEMLVKFWDLEGKMAKQLTGAKGPLARLAIRADAAQIVAADTAGRLLLWTAADGKLTQTIETGAVVNDISFSGDNLKLAAACADNHLRVFGTKEGKPLYELIGKSPILSARFAPDKTVITGDAGKVINTWADASQAVVVNLAGHTAQVNDIAYSPDGATVASCSTDGSIRIWNIASGDQTKQLAGHKGPVYSVAFNNDGTQLVSGGDDGTVRLWDVASGNESRKCEIAVAKGETPAPIFSVTFSHDGQRVAAVGKDQIVRTWAAASVGPAKEFKGHTDAIYLVAFSSNSARLLSCGHAGSLIVWNVADGAKLFTNKLPSVAYSAAYSPDGARIVASCSNASSVLVNVPAAAR
ncbi:MAG: WD40 repeat domain-containing protein [Pirellulales bacterium]